VPGLLKVLYTVLAKKKLDFAVVEEFRLNNVVKEWAVDFSIFFLN
jgi:hypothetical protein